MLIRNRFECTIRNIQDSRIKDLVFIVLLLPIMEPLLFKDYTVIDRIYTCMKLVSYFCMFLIVVCTRKRISTLSVCVILYELIILFSTIINGNGYAGFKVYVGPALAPIGICILFDIFRDRFLSCVKILRSVFLVYYFINILSVIYINWTSGTSFWAFKGDGYHFFLGIDNRFVFYFVPGLVCAAIVSIYEHNKLDLIFTGILLQSIFVLFKLWSVGGFLTMGMTAVFLGIGIRRVKGKWVNAYGYIALWILLNAILIVTALFFADDMINFVDLLLGKGANLKDRFVLWKNVFEAVGESPWYGIGINTIEKLSPILIIYNHAHNLLVNTLLKGGSIAVLVFLGILFIAARPLMDIRKTFLAKVLSLLLFSALFLSLADSYEDAYFYIVLADIYHITAIQVKETEESSISN